MMPFQVWFLQESRADHGFAIRYNVPSGFGAVQLRPSFVTSATAPSGHVHNLQAEDIRNSFLLYRSANSDARAWRQFPLWSPDVPEPTTLPLGEWCLFMPHGRILRPARPLEGWPLGDGETETETEPTEIRSGGRKALRKALRVRSRSPRPPLSFSAHKPAQSASVALTTGASPPLSAVRHLRRINERLTHENLDLRDRIAELERLLGR
jgi:hypothetical protein